MNETESERSGLELLLAEPEIVAWLTDRSPEPEEAGDDEPLEAA